MVGGDLPEIRGVLDQFCRGWEAGEAEGVLTCFARDEDTTVIGTDANEYWRGYSTFMEPFRTMASAFSSARYTWRADPVIAIHGDVAWADGILDTQLLASGQPVSATMRTTWVLQRRTEGWKVVQAHFSVAPDAAVVEY